MCRVCIQAKKLKPTEALNLIGASMSSGKDPDHFKKVLDEILDTPEPVVDEKADREWENEFGTTTRTNKL